MFLSDIKIQKNTVMHLDGVIHVNVFIFLVLFELTSLSHFIYFCDVETFQNLPIVSYVKF